MSTTVDLRKTYLAHQNLNSSPAKQYFSFPKQQRFNYGTKTYCNKPFYDIPDFKSARTTGLGKGTKSDFTMNDNRFKPGPSQYDLRSCFDKNKVKSKGFSFNSRTNLKFGSFPHVQSTPGPGQYEIDKRDKTQSFSLGKKLADPQMMTTVRENPGPGAHNLEGLNKIGQYHYANFSSSCATRFNPPTSIRLKSYKNPNPGPGTYEQENINQKCTYQDSKFKSAAGGRWAKGDRLKVAKKSKVPGPGYYKTLSEFGSTEFPPMQRVKASEQQRSNIGSPYAKSLQQTYSVYSRGSRQESQSNLQKNRQKTQSQTQLDKPSQQQQQQQQTQEQENQQQDQQQQQQQQQDQEPQQQPQQQQEDQQQQQE